MIKIDELQQKKLERFMQVQMKEYKTDSLTIGMGKFMFILAAIMGWELCMINPFEEDIVWTPWICLLAGAVNLMNFSMMLPPYQLPSSAGKYGNKGFRWMSMEYFPISRGQIAYFCVRTKWKACVMYALLAISGQVGISFLTHKENLLVGILTAIIVYIVLPLCVDGGYILFSKE